MAWYNISWAYRFKITSDQTKIDEAIDNVFYDLANAPAGFWTHVRSDGGDIRVTQSDETTEVAREVSGFNVGSTAGSLFFKATGLSAVADVDYYVYYGNGGATEPAAGDTYGKNNVWASYTAVFHLDESSGNAVCSKTGNALTPTNITYGATGKLGAGMSFNGSTSRLEGGDIYDITAAALSISAWINPSATDAFYQVVTKVAGNDRSGYFFRQNSSGGLSLEVADASSNAVPGSNNSVLTASSLQHVIVTYDGANARFYVGATAQGAPAETVVPANGTATFVIGNSSNAFDFAAFTGVIDEVRVSTSVRSANWITTEYNNQDSPGTFWTTNTETSNAGPQTFTPSPVTSAWAVPSVVLDGLTSIFSPFVEITDRRGTDAKVGIHTAYHDAATGSETAGFTWPGAADYAALTVAYKVTPATTQTLTLPFVP